MNPSDEVLMAYADGELDATTRQQVQDAMQKDPEVARRVAAHQSLRDSLRSGFDPVLNETVPQRLITAARSTPRPTAVAPVIPLHRPRTATRSVPRWVALAASFVLGALALQFGSAWLKPAAIDDRNGQLLASGPLAHALSQQLAGASAGAGPVQIGVSFRSRSGHFCRTFQLQEAGSVSGLACNEGGAWKLAILARTETPAVGAAPTGPARNGPAQYRTAASTLPDSIVRAVSESIDGEPLDAKSEAKARDQQWRDNQ